MYSVNYILNKDLSTEILDQIINIKSIAWPYPYSSQINWIRKNMSPLDIHVLLYKENIPVAYLNLIDTYVTVNGEVLKVYGVGNVCAIKRHEGFGKILMEKIGSFIENEGRMGLLFCRKPLLNFYFQLGWRFPKSISFSLIELEDDVKTLIFNMNNLDDNIEYSGIFF